MPRFFNTAGPNDPERHYTLPVLARLPDVRRLIDRGLYFVLHAPRQVGKTTTVHRLARDLTAEGTYVAALVTMEQGAPFSDDVGAAELAILESWRSSAVASLPPELVPPPWPDAPPGGRIGAALDAWAQAAPQRLVVFLDDIDTLEGIALLSILRQLRAGYPLRPTLFPWSIALVGLRNVRDYKVASNNPTSPSATSFFNITAESLTLRNLTRDEMAELYGQHTTETGQVFLPEAIERAYELTSGHPWEVNALARQLTQILVPDTTHPISSALVERAKESLLDPPPNPRALTAPLALPMIAPREECP